MTGKRKGRPSKLSPEVSRRLYSAVRQGSYLDACFYAGIDYSTLYDLRHTCATLLLEAGEHPKIVSEMLGHASIQLTLDTYSHVLPDMQQSAVDKMEGMLLSGERKCGMHTGLSFHTHFAHKQERDWDIHPAAFHHNTYHIAI